ncbi:hypothetical protein [Cerasicoccus frondis]|uniref:hypothetical protein n=1 Tax=Cerasicoccus frondis TaxID=490090 RepID=UPI002852CC6F|nr:hypothetical protein [Cerasicoccus frondis]
MKTIRIKLAIAAALSGISLVGCQSTPITPEEKAAYQKDEAVLQYEDQQQANEMEYLSGDGMEDGRELNP